MKKVLDNFYNDYSKEHSSAYVLLNKLNQDLKTNPDFAKRIDAIKNKL